MFCGFYHEDSLQVFPSMQPVGTAPHQRTIKGLMCFSLISLFCRKKDIYFSRFSSKSARLKSPISIHLQGLLVALDLELYCFDRNSQSLIRPTEKTIPERLPPRIAIREKSPLELPHILVRMGWKCGRDGRDGRDGNTIKHNETQFLTCQNM